MSGRGGSIPRPLLVKTTPVVHYLVYTIFGPKVLCSKKDSINGTSNPANVTCRECIIKALKAVS